MERFGDKVQCNPSVKLRKGNVYPQVSIDKITVGHKNVTSDELVTYTGQSGCKFQDNDVLMARITPCLENGKIAMANTGKGRGFGSTELFVFRGIENVSDTNYIYYLLRMPYMRNMAINSMTGASGRQRADIGFIKRIPWTYPSLDVQQKIAGMLSQFDTLIENNTKRIKILEKMSENLYKEWFVRLRFPGYENTEFIDGVPNGWENTTVEKLSHILRRGISPKYDDNGSLTVISQKCIRSNIMDIAEARKHTKVYNEELNLLDGDTVICSTGTGTLGRVGRVIGNYNRTTFDSHVTLVRAKKGVSKLYLYAALKELQPWFVNMGIGSTNQQELYAKTIRSAKVLLPKYSLMEKYDNFACKMDKEIGLLMRMNEKLIKQRDMLLPRLMRGELQVI